MLASLPTKLAVLLPPLQQYSSIPRYMVCPEYEQQACATFCSYPAVRSSRVASWLLPGKNRAAEFVPFFR